MSVQQKIPTLLLGGTGYVAGELLRLVSGHPGLHMKGIVSVGQPGESVGDIFTHLRSTVSELKFLSLADMKHQIASLPQSIILAAAPHGVSATLIDEILTSATAAGSTTQIVDISADFRYTSAAAYESVYKHPHGAPDRIGAFTCAVPEHCQGLPTTAHVAHPGCFATAILLATVPLMKHNYVEPQWFVAGVTGSTGSGRAPTAGTHHPQRHSDFYSYNALMHRHTPEVIALAAAATGMTAEYKFVPHSGPFARGIHITAQAKLTHNMSTDDVLAQLTAAYQHSPFVQVNKTMPHIKDVVASNYAHISAVTEGDTVSIMCTIDNLVKGAAGGAVQWANRLLGFDEALGLSAPAPGWT